MKPEPIWWAEARAMRAADATINHIVKTLRQQWRSVMMALNEGGFRDRELEIWRIRSAAKRAGVKAYALAAAPMLTAAERGRMIRAASLAFARGEIDRAELMRRVPAPQKLKAARDLAEAMS